MNQDILNKPVLNRLFCAICFLQQVSMHGLLIELGALDFRHISNPVPHPKAARQKENNVQR
jgi:hypothetical protein